MRKVTIGFGILLFILTCQVVSAAPFAYISNYSTGSNSVSVIDLSSNNVITTIPVGVNPYAVAVNPVAPMVYVGNYGDGSVSVIDTVSQTVTATVTVGTFPAGIAVNPSGTRAYVANYGSGTISVIDAAGNVVVDTITVASNPYGISINPAGTEAYVLHYNLPGQVTVINLSTNEVADTILVDAYPMALAFSPTGVKAYVTHYSGGILTAIDTSDHSTQTVTPGSGSLYGIALNGSGSRIYAANTSTNSLLVIDSSTNLVITTTAVGENPVGVSVDGQGRRVYVANALSNTITVIDTITNMVVKTIPVGTQPEAFGNFITRNEAPAPVRAFSSNYGSKNVSVIDTGTNTVIKTVDLSNAPLGSAGPYGVAVHPVEETAYVVSYGGPSYLTAIDSAYAITPMQVGWGARSLAISPSGSKIYVANDNDYTVSVIDKTSYSISDTISLPYGGSTYGGPFGGVVHPSGNPLYVPNKDEASTTLYKIDTATKAWTEITVGARSLGAAVSPSGDRLYVSKLNNSIAVIDTGTDAVLTTIPITTTTGLYGMAVNPSGTKLYVGGYSAEGGILVIDTATNTLSKVIPAPNAIMGISFLPDGLRAYAANTNNNNILAIDAVKDAIVGDPIAVGTSPMSHGKLVRDKFIVTVDITGTGTGTIEAGGLTCSGKTCQGAYAHTGTVTMTASAAPGSVFYQWTGCNVVSGVPQMDGATGNLCTVIVGSDKKVGALFLPVGTKAQTLTVTKSKVSKGDGLVAAQDGFINCGATCKHSYQPNVPVMLSAAPYAGSTFTGWKSSSASCPGTGPCTVTMDKAKSVQAVFVGPQKLTVSKVKTSKGDGTVSSDPAGINCGPACFAYFPLNESVTLTALANAGSYFTGWKGSSLTCPGTGPCTVTMDKAKSVQAVFVGPQKLSVKKQSKNKGAGTVSSDLPGIDCGPTCTSAFGYYTLHDTVTLTATPEAGSTFTGWLPTSLNCPGTDPCPVKMEKAATVTAVFSK